MLYEEGLEYEQCQNLSVAAERFYEDIFTPTSMTNEDPWKKTPMSVGLPTPPSTPEKSSQRIRNTKVVEANILTMNYNNNFYHSPVHQSPNSNLQVVPEGITSDDVQDIIPFLTDLGNRSMASPNFFDNAVSQGQCNSQTKRSPPPAESIAQSPTYHTEHVSVCGFHDTEQSFSHTNSIYADCSSEGEFLINYIFTRAPLFCSLPHPWKHSDVSGNFIFNIYVSWNPKLALLQGLIAQNTSTRL